MKGFNEKVYEALKKVPRGKVTTYKELAHALNSNAYRAVGQAMKRNPYAPIVPCHRVVASDGKIGGFSGQKSGTAILRKMELLKKEGIEFNGNKIRNFKNVLYGF